MTVSSHEGQHWLPVSQKDTDGRSLIGVVNCHGRSWKAAPCLCLVHSKQAQAEIKQSIGGPVSQRASEHRRSRSEVLACPEYLFWRQVLVCQALAYIPGPCATHH
jgi:hypothetical protein